MEHHREHLSLTAANTYRAFDTVLCPNLSTPLALCHSILALAYDLKSSITPMLSLLTARSPRLTSAEPT